MNNHIYLRILRWLMVIWLLCTFFSVSYIFGFCCFFLGWASTLFPISEYLACFDCFNAIGHELSRQLRTTVLLFVCQLLRMPAINNRFSWNLNFQLLSVVSPIPFSSVVALLFYFFLIHSVLFFCFFCFIPFQFFLLILWFSAYFVRFQFLCSNSSLVLVFFLSFSFFFCRYSRYTHTPSIRLCSITHRTIDIRWIILFWEPFWSSMRQTAFLLRRNSCVVFYLQVLQYVMLWPHKTKNK